MGEPMRGVVDTQVEAAFLGYGLQVGLSVLLERVLKVRIRKDQTYTDWTRRPLKPEQLAYARADVVHLLAAARPPARRSRAPRPARLGRGGAQAARGRRRATRRCPTRSASAPSRDGSGSTPSELAVLRELAAWRERAARRANIRPNFIANDVVLVTLASRPVEHVEELRGVRGLSAGTVDRHGRNIVAAIRAGRECPKRALAGAAGAHPPPGAAERPGRPAARGGAGGRRSGRARARGHRQRARPRRAGRARHGQGAEQSRSTGEPALLQGWRRDSSATRCSPSRAASSRCATTRRGARSVGEPQRR